MRPNGWVKVAPAVSDVREASDWTPAQIAALGFGLWWLGNGVAVFLVAEPHSTTLGADSTVELLGLSIAVNGWHGLFHLASGLTGVAVCRWPRSSSTYALLVGTTYLAAALCSVFTGATVFGLIHVDEVGSAEHAAEGAVLLAVWMASRRPSEIEPGR